MNQADHWACPLGVGRRAATLSARRSANARPFVLLLLLALPAHAQRMVDLHAARLVSDAGVEDVTGGVWLDDAKTMALARELVERKTRADHLEAHAGDMPTAWVVGAFVVGLLAGGAVVYAVTRAVK